MKYAESQAQGSQWIPTGRRISTWKDTRDTMTSVFFFASAFGRSCQWFWCAAHTC